MYFLPSTSFQVIDDNFTSVVSNQKPITANPPQQGMVMVNSPPNNPSNQQSIPQLDASVDIHESPYSIEELAADPSFSAAATCYYQQERMVSLETQYPNKSQHELVTMAIHEWHSKLTLSQKAKWLRIAERQGLLSVCRSTNPSHQNQGLVSMNYMNSGPPPPYGGGPMCLDEMLKREPKKPPKNGYSLFTSEQLAKYVNVEPQKRLAEVARIWRENVTQEEKEQYDARNKVLLAQYQRQLENFIETLTPEERFIYEDYCRKRNKYKHHKKKCKGDDGLEPKKKGKNKKKKEDHPQHPQHPQQHHQM